MHFNSFEYLFLFLPLLLLLYHLGRRTVTLSNSVILIASYLFYGWEKPWFVILLVITSVTDYFLGHAIRAARTHAGSKAFLILSCVLNIGFLSVFKYADWLSSLLHRAWPFIPVLALPLPPGISFYTFQSLSYTIDIYRKRLKPQGSIIDYLAFVSFFPHLVAGPILKAREILPQMEHVRPKVHPRIAEKAFFMICWGLFKKMVCADNLGQLVSLCRDNLDKTGAGLILALAFTFQIYADFSAYSDIARGTARLFGVRIPHNFLTPYFSRSPGEFWQRWHISLSTWIREYLYITLGGNQHGRLRTLFNLLVTMFLAGLWHGAGAFFILWGLYYGVLLVLYRLLPLNELLPRALGRSAGNLAAWALMFVFIVFGWVLFFSADAKMFHRILHSITCLTYLMPDDEFGKWAWGILLFAGPVILSDMLGYCIRREFADFYPRLALWVKVALYVLLFYAIVIFSARDSYDFIYFRF